MSWSRLLPHWQFRKVACFLVLTHLLEFCTLECSWVCPWTFFSMYTHLLLFLNKCMSRQLPNLYLEPRFLHSRKITYPSSYSTSPLGPDAKHIKHKSKTKFLIHYTPLIVFSSHLLKLQLHASSCPNQKSWSHPWLLLYSTSDSSANPTLKIYPKYHPGPSYYYLLPRSLQ